jgi:dihydropteroate synthase type 2
MHAIQPSGKADRSDGDAATIFDRVVQFFEGRLAALAAGGVARARCILDPGMGLFLGRGAEPSLVVLRRLGELRARFALPILVGVSRKSFLGNLTGRAVDERGPATLAAELWAARAGVDWIRTHDVRALRDALAVARAVEQGG